MQRYIALIALLTLFAHCTSTPVNREVPHTEPQHTSEQQGQDNANGETNNTAEPATDTVAQDGGIDASVREPTPEPMTDEPTQRTDEAALQTEPSMEQSADASAPDAQRDTTDTDVVTDKGQTKETRPEPTPREPRPKCIGPTGKDLCDDGDDCNGREYCDTNTGNCVTPKKPSCPIAPKECKQTGGTSGPKTDTLNLATPIGGFRLRDNNLWSKYTAIIEQVAKHSSATKVSLSTLLKDLNRTGTSLRTVPDMPCPEKAFKWNSGDTAVAYWYPQGLTGSHNSAYTQVGNKHILIASWYHKTSADTSTNTNKGVRLSFVDVSSGTYKYRHVLLVEPVMVNNRPSYRPVPIHAGGIAWRKQYLYVADTSKGFRVFDLSKIIRVATGNKNAIGYDATSKSYMGFGYRYVLPQINSYTRCSGSCCARFSFVSLSVQGSTQWLVSGEYTSTDQKGRLHRWPLDPATGRLITTNRAVLAKEVLYGGTRKMQGAVLVGSTFWISSSQRKSSTRTSPGSLVVGGRNKKRTLYRFPYPPEDMYYTPKDKVIWSHTEFPNRRYVYSLRTNNRSQCP